MKFILKEPTKFILSEAISLTEADDLGININDILDDDEATVEVEAVSDWEAEYTQAADKDMVWEQYFNAEWKAALDKTKFERIQKIQSALRAECEEYGFDNTNPFFSYIKNIYLPSNMSADVYNAIHNAVADQYLKTKDLLKTGILEDKNLIFCEHLWAQKNNVVTAYLKKQASLLQKEVPAYDENDKETPEFKTRADFVLYLLYEDENKTKLRPLNKINELELKLTKSVSGRLGDDEIDVDTPAVIKRIGDKKDLIELAATLILNFKLTDSKVVPEITKRLTELNSTTWGDVNKLIGKVLNQTNLTLINKNQAKELITAINRYLNPKASAE